MISDDIIAATASYATTEDPPFDPTQVPVDPSFWGNLDASRVVAQVCSDYGLEPRLAAMPAAWRLWLADCPELDYAELRRQAEAIGRDEWLAKAPDALGALPATFFWFLLHAGEPSVAGDMLRLARSTATELARVGLLSVLPGEVETSAGRAELLWIGKRSLVCRVGDREFEVDCDRATLYRVLREPRLLGRSALSPSDTCPRTTRSQAQADLLRSLDLAQSAEPPVGHRDPLRSWLSSPPSFCWVGSPDAAIYYRVATEVFGASCVLVAAAFLNPSTGESCCAQATPAEAKPGPAEPPPELLAADFVLGVANRPPPVVDSAGRGWWGGPVDLFRQNDQTVPRLGKRIDPISLRAELIACGCDPADVRQAVERLVAVQPL